MKYCINPHNDAQPSLCANNKINNLVKIRQVE